MTILVHLVGFGAGLAASRSQHAVFGPEIACFIPFHFAVAALLALALVFQAGIIIGKIGTRGVFADHRAGLIGLISRSAATLSGSRSTRGRLLRGM